MKIQEQDSTKVPQISSENQPNYLVSFLGKERDVPVVVRYEGEKRDRDRDRSGRRRGKRTAAERRGRWVLRGERG